MSAAVYVLPRVWALASPAPAAPAIAEPVILAPQPTALPGPVTGRKGPHALRLVRASASATVAVMRPAPEPELAFYRKHTEGMLRRYVTLSMEAGRVPSLLGREMFRGRVTSCRVRGFDDVVIFTHDMERCLVTLEAGQQELIRRIALQEYTQGEAAAMLGISLRTVVRRYAAALDRLTAVLLERKLLEPMMLGGDVC